jgi:hypothetical protein
MNKKALKLLFDLLSLPLYMVEEMERIFYSEPFTATAKSVIFQGRYSSLQNV